MADENAITRGISLILRNDEGHYHAVNSMVFHAVDEEHPQGALRELLKNYVEQIVYGFDGEIAEGLNPMTREILGDALGEADFWELAGEYLEDAKEEAANA